MRVMEDHRPTSPKQRGRPRLGACAAAAEPAQPWTATRCHRLLRPLLAHIAALRKDKERRALVHGGGLGAGAPGHSARPRRTVLGKRSYPDSDSDYSDRKTKTCRKYSRKALRRTSSSEHACTPDRNAQRQRRQPGNKAASQDVVLPTPFLRRVRNHQPSSPSQPPDEPCQEELAEAGSRCHHSGSGCKARCAFELELAALRPTMDAERHGLYESVFKAFDSLLRVTSPRKNQTAWSKSLLAMCLRKVPAYMAALEEWERKDADESGTRSTLQGAGVSFDIYSELESLGAVDGWRHLCLLVRAHGVRIVQDAVSEGLLEDPVTDLLIRVCLEYMPPTECMSLIETFAVRQYPRPRSHDDDLFTSPALQPLRILRSCGPSGNPFMSAMLAHLLGEELLPSGWILTNSFVSLWPSMVRQITEMKPCQDIVDFVVTTLELLCDLASPRRPRGVPQTRLRGKPQTTLVSAVAALGSVVLLSEEGSSDCGGNPTVDRAATLRRRIQYVVVNCSAKLKRRKKGGRKLGTYLLALCSFLSLEADPASAAMVEASWKGVQNCRGNESLMLQYDATTALMSAMAHYCGRGTGLAPNVYLSQFCDKLETLQLPGGALRNMRVDGAIRLAEHTGDLRDLAFAENLRAKAAASSAPEQTTPGRKTSSFSGIRWDDGISEWVAATPATDVPRAARFTSRLRSSGQAPGPAESEGEDDESTDHGASATDDDADPVSSPADDESDGASETGEEDDDNSLLSTTFVPAAVNPVADADQEPSPDTQQTGSPDKSSNEQPENPSPPPPGGFLAVRPRRLSRRLSRAVLADDELAFDNDDNKNSNSLSHNNCTHPGDEEENKENSSWLSRKKPARFRRLPVSVPPGPANAAISAGSAKATGFRSKQPPPPPLHKPRKRVARASLVYQLRQPPAERAIVRYRNGEGEGDEGSSGDELSIL